MIQHIETPYVVLLSPSSGRTLISHNGKSIASCTTWLDRKENIQRAEANARFIVKACNNHEKLVAALENIYEYANSSPDMTPTSTQMIMAKCWLALCPLEKDGE